MRQQMREKRELVAGRHWWSPW